MAVSMNYEYQGLVGLDAGEIVEIGWCLAEGEFPPLIDGTHGVLRGGGRQFVEVRRTVDEGVTHGQHCRAFFYTVRNVSSGWVYIANHYIFPKAT